MGDSSNCTVTREFGDCYLWEVARPAVGMVVPNPQAKT